MSQVAPGDEVALGVVGQPAGAEAHQLVDLVRADPVVLAVVEHRQQHVQVGEGVGQPHGAAQAEVDVGRVTPAGTPWDQAGCGSP